MNKIFAIAILTLLCNSCYKDIDKYVESHKNKILYVSASASSVPADGKSMLVLTAGISKDADLRTIHFSTTKGHFLDSNLTYTATAAMRNDSLLTTIYVIPTQESDDLVFVTVSVPGLDSVLNISFVVAQPDSIHIESAVKSIPRGYGSEVPLQTRLMRTIGYPSLHQTATFLAITEKDSVIGSFRGIDPTGSDSMGLINSIFVLSDTVYTGKVRIAATFPTIGKPLTDTFTVFVTNK